MLCYIVSLGFNVACFAGFSVFVRGFRPYRLSLPRHLTADNGTINPSEVPAIALTIPTTRKLPSPSV